MAQRNFSFDGIVLRVREIPSGGRVVSLLSAEEGLVEAFMFGGSKSKLRSLAAPWHEGRVWLYRDEQKGFVKLSDFDAILEFPSIRGNLEALSVAGFVSEFLTVTSALGGENEAAFSLAHDCLMGLESMLSARGGTMPEQWHLPVLLQFCLRSLSLMGMLPDADFCCLCAGTIAPNALHSYARQHAGFACPECRGGDETGDTFLDLPAGAVVWMEKTLALPFAQAVRVGLASSALAALEGCILDIVREAADAPLRTLPGLAALR